MAGSKWNRHNLERLQPETRETMSQENKNASRGRGPKSREARTVSLAVRLTENEVTLLRAAAVQANVSVREWMRQQLLTAAQGPTDDLLFTEVVGLNLLMQTTLRWVLSSYALPPGRFDQALLEVRDQKAFHARALRERFRKNYGAVQAVSAGVGGSVDQAQAQNTAQAFK